MKFPLKNPRQTAILIRRISLAFLMIALLAGGIFFSLALDPKPNFA